MRHKRAVFFDRDGTILVPPEEYIARPDQVKFYPGVVESLNLLKGQGFRRVVVTNQAAVGRGMISEMDLLSVHNHMKRELAAQNADLDAILYSPHYPAAAHAEHRGRSSERKPGAGLFEQAAKTFRLSLKDSFVVGDRLEDIESARAIGAKAILVRTGKGAETEKSLRGPAAPDFVTDDVAGATIWICRQVCETPLAGKTAVFVIAGRNFQDREYLVTRMILESLGANIQVAGPGRDECVGSDGLRVMPDTTHHAVDLDGADAVVFIGGEGARALIECKECQDLARRTYQAKKVLAAICVAPSILANAHILSRKRATAWHTEIPNLRKQGVIVSREAVTRDENIVTAAGPKNVYGFAGLIRAALLGEKEIKMTVASSSAAS